MNILDYLQDIIFYGCGGYLGGELCGDKKYKFIHRILIIGILSCAIECVYDLGVKF